MKNLLLLLFTCTLTLTLSCSTKENEWIRINQLGYRTNDNKVAVYLSKKNINLKSFTLIDATSGKTIMTFENPVKSAPMEPFTACYRLQFTKYARPGTYRIAAGKAVSPENRRVCLNMLTGQQALPLLLASFLLLLPLEPKCTKALIRNFQDNSLKKPWMPLITD